MVRRTVTVMLLAFAACVCARPQGAAAPASTEQAPASPAERRPIIEARRPTAVEVVRMHPKVATAFIAADGVALGARGSGEVRLTRSEDGHVVIATIGACTSGYRTNIIIYAGGDVYAFDVVCADAPEAATQVVRVGEPGRRVPDIVREMYRFIAGTRREKDGCLDLGKNVMLCRYRRNDCKRSLPLGEYTEYTLCGMK